MRIILILTLFFSVIGCGEQKSPSNIYEEYNSKVITGLSFDEEKMYFSTQKIAEVESSFPRYMAQMKKSKDEVIDFYLKLSQSVAKCKAITLIEENIADDHAVLIYSQSDICNSQSSDDEKQIINLVNENGWKISSVEISL